MIEIGILHLIDRSFRMTKWARCKRIYRISVSSYPQVSMRFSTIALLAVAATVFSATAVGAEEPERADGYNVPETAVVPLSLLNTPGAVADGEKFSSAKTENSVMRIDDNNRLAGLSN